MARIARLVLTGEKAVYHVISRTALPGLPLQNVEKDHFVHLVKQKSKLYFTEILGYSVMGNHFHLLVRMMPGTDFTDREIETRFKRYYGDLRDFSPDQIPFYREKWESLSEFIKEIKQEFSRFYNKRHNRQGYFWGDRFKSLIVQDGNSLINCLAYIDLNPVRAGIVDRPEDYRWSSIGYHVQANNRNDFLSLDFGLKEYGIIDDRERLKRYRKLLYEIGSKDRNAAGKIDKKIVKKERERDYKLSHRDRLLYRTRYFTDSGVIGSKEFVAKTYQRFKHVYQCKRDKIPRSINGLEGIYSLKRLSSQT